MYDWYRAEAMVYVYREWMGSGFLLDGCVRVCACMRVCVFMCVCVCLSGIVSDRLKATEVESLSHVAFLPVFSLLSGSSLVPRKIKQTLTPPQTPSTHLKSPTQRHTDTGRAEERKEVHSRQKPCLWVSTTSKVSQNIDLHFSREMFIFLIVKMDYNETARA